jgi:hypothetical protein
MDHGTEAVCLIRCVAVIIYVSASARCPSCPCLCIRACGPPLSAPEPSPSFYHLMSGAWAGVAAGGAPAPAPELAAAVGAAAEAMAASATASIYKLVYFRLYRVHC